MIIGKATTSAQKRGCSLLPRYNKVLVGPLFLFFFFFLIERYCDPLKVDKMYIEMTWT